MDNMDNTIVGLPALRGGLPWLGHSIGFGRNPMAFLRNAWQRSGNVFSFKLFGQPVVFLCGPQANAAFFRAPDDVLSAKEAYKFMTPVFGEGVAYDATPELMDEQISLLMPAMSAKRMQLYASLMESETLSYLGSWGSDGETNLYHAMNTLTVALVSRCLFGDQFSPSMLAELPALYHDLGSGIRLGGLLNPHLPLPPFRRRDRARQRIKHLIGQMIAQRLRENPEEQNDFLGTLLSARYANGERLSDDTISGLVLTIIFAGQHTTASLATWTGILLLENPGYLPDLVTEQKAVFDGDTGMTTQKLHRLEKLDSCVKEAERMRPPLTMLMRIAVKPFAYQGFEISPGTMVMISPAVSHRLPEVFSEPDRYDPGRFNAERQEDRRTPGALIGFGGGKHRCIGLAFAYQQTKIIWSTLLRTFDLELAQQPNQPDYSTLMSLPKQPCSIRYRRK